MNGDATQFVEQSTGVDRVAHPYSVTEFKEHYLLSRKPLVINAEDFKRLEWRTQRWTSQYLIERVGSVPVMVQVKQEGVFGSGKPGEHTRMPFDVFVQKVMAPESGGSDLYLNLQHSDLQITPPVQQLLGDFNLPVYFHDRSIRWINLWMGNTNNPSKSRLHHDYHDNLYCVVQGRKEFIIFPPQDAAYLYPKGNIVGIEPNGRIHYSRSEIGKQPHFCAIDTQHVDVSRFPKYAFAHPQRVVVGPGEMFFLPTGWFHEVQSVGLHIALNFWAEPPESKQVSS